MSITASRSWMAGGWLACAVLLAGVVQGQQPTGRGDRDALVESGRRLFFTETFAGNGRTCATCHRRETNFALDPVFIATLPATDPLFVAEFTPALRQHFERPDLMRRFGLILANTDGFDDLERTHVMRSPQHLFALRTSVDNYKGPRTGWGGDGAPGDGALRSFAIGAVRQHMPKTIARRAGIDFRVPTPRELDALEAFMLSLGRQEDWQLPLPLRHAIARRGQDLFLDPQMKNGRCNLCHFNAGATAISASDYPRLVHIGNNNFATGEEALPGEPASLLPPDDGFGDTRDFNTPPLIEAADTGPYFHNNAVSSIEEAIASYNDESFAQSRTGAALEKRFGARTTLDANEVLAIGVFLRVINALENIRQSEEHVAEAMRLGAREVERATWLIEQADYETADAERVLGGVNLHPVAVARLGDARGWQRQAVDRVAERAVLLAHARAAYEAARADLIEAWPPRPARYTIQPPTP
ncbi:MAG: hypothetical protein FJW23_16100 [Acidimicrobiia bacterium]|nr:hypothetical protein [Acidimicrobiia bacterium]